MICKPLVFFKHIFKEKEYMIKLMRERSKKNKREGERENFLVEEFDVPS